MRFHRELILTGSASLGKPKTEEELKQAFEVATAEIPDEMQRYKHTHEGQFKKFLDDNGETYTFNRMSADDPSVCGRYRPDFLFQLPTHHIVVEVDENEHAHEDPACEVIRTLKMVHGLGLHTIFLRFNPDGTAKKEDVLERLRYYKTLAAGEVEALPLLTVEYFGYSTPRVRQLQKIQEEQILLDPGAMIKSLKEVCHSKDEELKTKDETISQLQDALKNVRPKKSRGPQAGAKNQRKTLADYQALARERGLEYILTEIPKTSATRVAGWKCSECNGIISWTFGNIKHRFHGCSECRKVGRKRIEDYKLLGQTWGLDFTAAEIPQDVRSHTSWRCLKHGVSVIDSFRNLQRLSSTPCAICNR